MKRVFVLYMAMILAAGVLRPAEKREDFRLTPQGAESFARLALDCIAKEYPNKIGHVLNSDADAHPPCDLHPAFYGCFDWHSAVHGHWSLVRILKLYPGIPLAGEIRAAINRNLTAENLRQEVQYFQGEGRQSFERTYGWAWLLKLCEELHTWEDPQGKKWRENLRPLEELIVDYYLNFLPRQNYPIRTGVHPNTAFGLLFALDYARTTGHQNLADMVTRRGADYYRSDRNCPVNWEPGGEDFFSPCLMEAFLMSRLLSAPEFNRWFRSFMPGFFRKFSGPLLEPATVLDRSDGKLVHLDGLNLSRAWCLFGIAPLIDDPEVRDRMMELGREHGRSALQNMKSEDYAGGHWLGTFAVYMFHCREDRGR